MHATNGNFSECLEKMPNTVSDFSFNNVKVPAENI